MAAPGDKPEDQAPSPMVAPIFLTELADIPPEPTTEKVPTTQELRQIEAAGKPKYIYTDGQRISVEQHTPETPLEEHPSPAPQPVAREKPVGADPFGWKQIDKSSLARIIAINYAKLEAGNQRMNIIIRNDDIIQVTPLKYGEFYVMGEVLRPGSYQLTGRRLTIKQAIASAGNLAPLAWPENAVLFRRIGDNQEKIIPLDLEAIFKGQQADLFLKPDDIIAVGTDVRTSFMAVMRNAFRMTYGFGFIYDRNFADPLFGTINSDRFTRW